MTNVIFPILAAVAGFAGTMYAVSMPKSNPAKPMPRVPRYELRWHKSRTDTGEVVLWTWNPRRASTVASRLEWTGWFTVNDSNDGSIIEGPFRS
jgi:hypothetical protein